MLLVELWQGSSGFFLTSVFVVGLLFGSFLNVVIHRLPIIMKQRWRSDCIEYLCESGDLQNPPAADKQAYTLSTPRSACPHCGHKITALENIPVLSYLFLRGRCRGCKAGISIRYPLVELLTAGMITLVAWKMGVSIAAVLAMGLTLGLIALSFIDYDTQYLPDDITLPFLWAGLIINSNGVLTDPVSAIVGASAGYLSLWSVYKVFKLATGKEGMGYGDFKLLAMLGAWLGWQALPAIILLSSVVGAVIGLSLVAAKRHERAKPIPFGPYLAIAGWIFLLWGQEINSAYLNWLGAGGVT